MSLNYTPKFGGSLGQEFARIWAELERNRIISAPGVRTSRTTRGTILEGLGKGGSGGGGDGLSAGGDAGQFLEKYGNGDGEASWVDHPEHVSLEESIISSIDYQPDGKAILRIWTVGGGSNTIAPPPNLRTLPQADALIFPAYSVNDHIFHMAGQDLNVDARMWVIPNEACEWDGQQYITKTVYTLP